MPDPPEPTPQEATLAPYATRSNQCGGRRHTEPIESPRTPFELDRHRIIESTAFRRLEGKTQVFEASEHDHFRTRLTHTLEVANIARTLAARLNANAELAEAIALAHDLGHPPFGHAGETALNEIMADHGGFNHNLHALRVVEYLEHPFPPFRGLNLTAATRDGLSTHETPYDRPALGEASPHDEPAGGEAPPHDESAESHIRGPSVEAQIASVADRIAYNCHDLEDAIGAAFIDAHDLEQIHLWSTARAKAIGPKPTDRIFAIRRAVLDTMLDGMLADIVTTSRQRLASQPPLDKMNARDPRDDRPPLAPTDPDPRDDQPTLATPTPPNDHAPYRRHPCLHPCVAPSDTMQAHLTELERFLTDRVYRQPALAKMDDRGRTTITALFEAYTADPHAMPQRFAQRIEHQGVHRVICDYIAGMTDRFCQTEHQRMVPR